jgi:RNA polymerase-binding transcription factor DksA
MTLGSGKQPGRSGKEVIVNERRARQLVARERARVESMLAELGGDIRAEGSLQRQQPGDSTDAGSARNAESITVALESDLREQLAAVGRAEERLARGMYGRSVESGIPTPAARLAAEPLAERTIEEQRLYERQRPN